MTNNEPSTRSLLAALSTTDRSADSFARRRFLQGALAMGGATALGPIWNMPGAAAAGPPLGADERILIVLMMGGGNDGFKMISPLDNATFTGTRGLLADDPETSHPIGQGLYLNEHLPVIRDLWEAGDVACVLGVGNSFDDRSHFSSMASWMAADLSPPYDSGWLGRHVDGAGYSELGSINIGDSGVPLHLRGRNQLATGISSWGRLFGASEYDADQRRYRAMERYSASSSGLGPWVDAAGSTFSQAINVAQEISPAYEPLLDGDDDLTRSLVVAAGLINLDVGVRVLGTGYGDFDHHDDQAYPYMQRMTELNTAVSRFYQELDPAFANRVVIATFSEFGRSFVPNGSNGTDHGTASNLMVIGRNVKGGMYGQLPDFGDLDDWGDVNHTVDFRSYYASLLGGWLDSDPNEVLGGNYEDLGLFERNAIGSGSAALTVSCLNNDGRFDINLVNAGESATFTVEVSGLPPRIVTLAADESQTITVTGRPDREYVVRVLRDGNEIMDEAVTVGCDPARGEVEVDQSCLAQNGRFDVHLYNSGSAAATYRVILSGLQPRLKVLEPGQAGRITFTGRRDGAYTVNVSRNGQQIHGSATSVRCDPIGPEVSVASSCLAGMGRIDVHVSNDSAAAKTYRVTIGRLQPRTRTVGAGDKVRISATGRPDGDLTVVVSSGDDEVHRSTEAVACAV